MNDTVVLDTLKTSFKMEIENVFKINKDSIVVTLADGTKAKITTKNVV